MFVCMKKSKLHLIWDYLQHLNFGPDAIDKKQAQLDWNQTLITKFNNIGVNQFPGELLGNIKVVVNPVLKPLIESLVYHMDGKIAKKYVVEYSHEQTRNVIDIMGNTITILNFRRL
jgi:hypothetical protein